MSNVNINIMILNFYVNRYGYIFLYFFYFFCYIFFMTKADLRKEIKKRISAEKNESLKSQSDSICKKILESKDFIECHYLLAYMPLPDEVDVSPVILAALSQNKKVFLPRIFPGSSRMEFYRFEKDSQTSKGSFGIMEPQADERNNLFSLFKNIKDAASKKAPSEKMLSLNKILILVPGRAFTKDGKRLGRGKGFYDIYFSRLTQARLADSEYFKIKKSGVCFSCQLLADLPATPDDVLMDSLYCPSI